MVPGILHYFQVRMHIWIEQANCVMPFTELSIYVVYANKVSCMLAYSINVLWTIYLMKIIRKSYSCKAIARKSLVNPTIKQ